MSLQSTKVICVIATFRRPKTLDLLLRSLAKPDNEIAEVILVDNANDPATAALVGQVPVPVRRLVPRTNLGCGGGVRRGLEEALKDTAATHFWLLDDDALAFPGALEKMIQGMASTRAELAVPSVLDSNGHISWCAGLLRPGPDWTLKHKRVTPQEYLELFGKEPVPFTWAPWPSLLLTRRAVEIAGFPRDDFWLMGEDLEFTLRLTDHFRGVYVPEALCGHYPPPSSVNSQDGELRHRIKFCSMLQNTAYAALHLKHCRRILRHLPGNYLRFLRTFGLSPSTFSDAALAFWRGGVCGKPGATPGYDQFHQRWLANQ